MLKLGTEKIRKIIDITKVGLAYEVVRDKVNNELARARRKRGIRKARSRRIARREEDMAKDRHQKTALEMDFEEFLAWSVGMVLFGIGRGEKLRDIMRHILNHASLNEVWGGEKKG